MKTLFLTLAAVAGSLAARPALAQVSKFHGDLGMGLVPLRSTGPNYDHSGPYYNAAGDGFALETINANLITFNMNLGFDAPLLQFKGGKQSLGVSLNAGAGLMGAPERADGFNQSLILDFPEYVTYRLGAKASKHADSDFGLGLGLGYRFCHFFLPFNSPSAMIEVVYAAKDADWMVRLSTDLRPRRFYNYYSSEGYVEVMRIQQFTLLIGKSF